MRFLFRVTRHSAFVRISINTSQGFPYSAHNLLETRQFRPQLGEFFRLFREVILVATNPIRQIAEFFVWHFGMALFRPRSGRLGVGFIADFGEAFAKNAHSAYRTSAKIVKSIARAELSSNCHTK